MTTLFVILIIVVSAVLGLIVLVQNPKGGGLAGNVAGFSNQLMGVKQTTDVLEKGTWIFGGLIALLCLLSVFFISNTTTANASGPGVDPTKVTVPVQQQPQPGTNLQPTPTPAPVPPAK
ncbi:MAG TPA: preprotein translocase subunit SecG [Chitinophagaceae bacterium]|nr:preprotein translocase subunit SecG [Chitinophagaceae bacterium]HPN58176.1 preprotein translocase subunit SecG [Chitinophagaceae bacterium]